MSQLVIEVLAADKLPNIGLNRPPSAYVAFTHNWKFHATDIKESTQSPRWGNQFLLDISEQHMNCLLELTVYNSNKTDVDEVLGACSISYSELATNKPTDSELALGTGVSRLHIRHCIKATSIAEQQPIPISTAIQIRLIDVIGSQESAEMSIEYGSQTQRISKGSNAKLDTVRFRYAVENEQLRFSYIPHAEEEMGTQPYESRKTDIRNLNMSQPNFLKLGFAKSGTTHKKIAVICISLLSSAVSSDELDSVVVELQPRPAKKDYFLRIVGPLGEDVLNQRRLISSKLGCQMDGILFMQYFENRGFKQFNFELTNSRPDAEYYTPMSSLRWEQKGKELSAAHKLVEKDDGLRQSSFGLQLKLLRTKGQTKELLEEATPKAPALKKPVRLAITKLAIGGCYLYEVLQKAQLCFMVKDSEGTLYFSQAIQGKDYSWKVALPVLMTNRNKYILQLTLLDRMIDFGEKLLSPLENSMIFRVNFDLTDLSQEVMQSKELQYTQQFKKYAKKTVLVQPQSTKSFVSMVDQQSAVVKLAFTNVQSYQYSSAAVILLNAKVSSKQANNRRSLSLMLDGVGFHYSAQTPYSYMLRQPQRIPINKLAGSASLTVYDEKDNVSLPLLSLYKSVQDLIPINPGKRVRLELGLPNTEDKLTLFYAVDSEKQTVLTRPQQVVNSRIAASQACHYRVRLVELSVQPPSYEKLSLTCETTLNKYQSQEYYLQTSRVKLADSECFFVQFDNEEKEGSKSQAIFFTLSLKVKSGSEMYNGYLDLCQLYSNGEEAYCTVVLTKTQEKAQSGTILTIAVSGYTCPVLRQLAPSSTVTISLDMRYAVQLTRQPEGVLRPTASYVVRVTLRKQRYYLVGTVMPDRISDIEPTYLDDGVDKQYLNNINDRRYTVSVRFGKQLLLDFSGSDLSSSVCFELLSASRATFEKQIRDPANIDKTFQKLAEGSKPLIELVDETAKTQYQTVSLGLCRPTEYSLRFSKQGILSHQAGTSVALIYQPKVAGEVLKQVSFKPPKVVPAEFLTKAVYELAVSGISNLTREGLSIQNEIILQGETKLKQSYDLGIVATMPSSFAVRPSLNPAPSLNLTVKRLFEDTVSGQLAQQQIKQQLPLSKLAIKSNQTFQQLLVLGHQSIPTEQLSLRLRLHSNRFSDNPEGVLSISHIGISPLEGGQFDLEVRLVDINSCRVSHIDGRNYLNEAVKSSRLVSSRTVEASAKANLITKDVTAQTSSATDGLMVVLYSQSKKVVCAAAVVELYSLRLDKLTDEQFQYAKPLLVGSTKAVLTLRGNYRSTLAEKLKLGDSVIMEKPVENKYRLGLGGELLVMLPKPYPQLLTKSTQQPGLSAKEYCRFSIKPGQLVSFKTLMTGVQLYLVASKRYLIDPSGYRAVYEADKSTRLAIESECVMVLDEMDVSKLQLQFTNSDGKQVVIRALKVEQQKPNQTALSYVFDRSYQVITIARQRFMSRGIPKNCLIQIQPHTIVRKQADSTELILTSKPSPIIRLAGSSQQSILTSKFRLVISSNGQYESTHIIDNAGRFEHPSCHRVGFSEQDPVVQFDLLLDNCFNRSQQLAHLFEEADWMKQMIICRGRLHLGEAFSSDNRNVCVPLFPYLVTKEGIASSFSKLLEKENLCLLGSLDTLPARWGFLTVKVLSLSNLLLKDNTKGMLSVKLSIVKQEDKNKEVLRQFQTDFLTLGRSLTFRDETAFTERLIVDASSQLYDLYVFVLVHYSTHSVTLCQKRYSLTDILSSLSDRKEEVRLQIRPEESLQLNGIAQLKLNLFQSFTHSTLKATPPVSASQNKIDIVDFRSKKDAQLIEILLLSHRTSQLLTTLDEIKQSYIFTNGDREDLSNVLLLFMKVYQDHQVASSVFQCLEIYLVKQPQFLAVLDRIGLYLQLKGMFTKQTEGTTMVSEGDLKGIVLTKDWPSLEAYILSKKLSNAEKDNPNRSRLVEVALSFILIILTRSKTMMESMRSQMEFWYEVVDTQATTKGKTLFKDLLRMVYTDSSSPNQKEAAKLFEYLLLGSFEECECYLYSIHRLLHKDEIVREQYYSHLVEIAQRKQWNIDLASAVELFYQNATEADFQSFKLETVESVCQSTIREIKRVVDDPSQHLNLLLKKLFSILSTLLGKCKPEPFNKSALVAHLKEREKAIKADRKLLITQFCRKLEGEPSLRASRVPPKKNASENRYLISKLDY